MSIDTGSKPHVVARRMIGRSLYWTCLECGWIDGAYGNEKPNGCPNAVMSTEADLDPLTVRVVVAGARRIAQFFGNDEWDQVPAAMQAVATALAAQVIEAAKAEAARVPEACPCPDLAGDCHGDHTAAIAACPSRVDHPLMEACGSCAYRYGGPR